MSFQITPPPNNGLHPTADTLLVIYFPRGGAAGDAGRYAPCEGEVPGVPSQVTGGR